MPKHSVLIALFAATAVGAYYLYAGVEGQGPTNAVVAGAPVANAQAPDATDDRSSAATDTCRPPRDFAMPRVNRPDPTEVRRTVVTRYTLALSWSPAYCARTRSAGRMDAADAMQCSGAAGSFGFVLHGLWPETRGRDWPQYCRPAGPVARETLRRHLCMTPSPDLLQHEWERHGSCMASSPEAYFETAARVYDRVVMPDVDRGSRPDGALATAGALRRAFAAANPGLSPRMISVMLRSGGWLDEVRLCLDRNFAYADCPVDSRGAADGARLRVEPRQGR